MQKAPKPVVLAILDGWGHRHELDHNAIAAAHTPNWDFLWNECPASLIDASELHVGLPEGQMGNSEVGHMNIGAGRVILQDLPRIDESIKDGTLAKNPELIKFISALKQSGGACHLMGLFSDGGVHSHMNHMDALAEMVSNAGIKVWIHAFLDGRDTPPKSAGKYLSEWQSRFAKNANVQFGTVIGRYYAMDRDKRWDRVSKAFDAIVTGKGEQFSTAENALAARYEADQTDEFVLPCLISDYDGMNAGDGLLMANFRADRARQLLAAMLDSSFSGFEISARPELAATLGMIEYSEALNPFIPALFPPETPTNTLAEVVSKAGLKQLHIAETEKYAHVTFFLNGGREEPFSGEDRILIPSPNVPTYDMKPEMSAYEVADKIVESITADRYDVIIVNFANTDMVGHTGDIVAAQKAVEAVDNCLGRIRKAVEEKGGVLLITADHGNAEMMFDHGTDQAHTAHTLNRVPFVVYAPWLAKQAATLHADGRLADVAPTVLQFLGLPQPKEMTGRSMVASIAGDGLTRAIQ